MATFYVDGLVGNDTNSGTAEGASYALATIQAGVAKLTSGSYDTLYVKATTTYSEAVTITIPGDVTSLTVLTIEGYTGTPGAGGIVTMDGTGSLLHGFSLGSASGHMVVRNFYITDYTDDGFYCPASDYMTLENVECHSNGGNGIRLDNYNKLINCSATSNGEDGIDYDASTWILGGVWRDNAQWNIYNFGDSSSQRIIGTIIARGTLGNVYMTGGDFMHNTVDGGGSVNGLYFNQSVQNHGYNVVNNIFYDCVTGIVGPTITRGSLFFTKNNLYDACTTTYLRWQDDGTDVHDTAGLNSDYTLSATSAARDAGYVMEHQPSGFVVDIGAFQRAPAAGGTSRVILTS